MKNELTPEQVKLVEDHFNFVRYIVNKHLPYSLDRPEIHSDGYMGLIKAAKTYDASLGYEFTTYAARCILNYVYSRHGRNCSKQDKTSLSLDYEYVRDDGSHVPFYNYIVNTDIDFDYENLRMCLEEFLEKRATPKQAYCLRKSLEGYTATEIAEMVGVTRAHISKILIDTRIRFKTFVNSM